jgi:hypothetical protein
VVSLLRGQGNPEQDDVSRPALTGASFSVAMQTSFPVPTGSFGVVADAILLAAYRQT